MPIYEFYCEKCHMIFNFFSKSINTDKKPICPKCRKTTLDRRMSIFSRPRHQDQEDDMPLPDMDESKMEKAMALLVREAEHVDEEDPRQAANLMRKLTDMTGMALGSGMEEALSRMEAGEDPETIEAEMGDILEQEDPFVMGKKTLKPSRVLPPRVDETLYDL
ncbi:MAG: zinc ribbon domain-containing protein [Deltaproteobacteria bacterium]|nr:zinc ribbon domain-containing protein [Deltaproteobacteria bacterium]